MTRLHSTVFANLSSEGRYTHSLRGGDEQRAGEPEQKLAYMQSQGYGQRLFCSNAVSGQAKHDRCLI